MKKLFYVPILTLLFLSLATMASADWKTTRLTTNLSTDWNPQINANGYVVWQGSGSPYEIFYYNGTTVTQLSTNSSMTWDGDINANGHVVWRAYGGSDGGSDYEIFYYDGTTVTQLTTNSNFYDDYSCKINANGHVVWQGQGGSDAGSDYEIFYYDGTTVTQLTTNSDYDSAPKINTIGRVVWRGDGGSDGGSDWEVFYYDGTTVTQLTTNTGLDSSIQMNANGHLVWEGWRWEYDEYDTEIYYYDGTTVTQLTTNLVPDNNPKINANNQVVWQGYGGSDNGSEYEIFYYDGYSVTQLTQNDYNDEKPKINASGNVVWEGDAAGDVCDASPLCGWEIFIAEFAFQNIQLAESDCIKCHTNREASVDNHHSLYGNVIIPVPTAVPYPLVGGVVGCLSCHDEDTGEILIIETECTFCHGSVWTDISAQAHQLDEAGCRTCHDSTGETTADTHHLFYQNVIPNPTVAPYGTPGGEFGCLSCHDEDTGGILRIETNCAICHVPTYCDGLILAGNGLNPDSDADSVADIIDNCPSICNSNQLDADGDGIGDVCDASPGCGGVSCGVPQPECEDSCGSEGCGG
jgi:hypothetical protein